MIFQNREEAGRCLAAALQHYRDRPDGLIVALPRGGVAVGYAMFVGLHLPLDVFITRKIGVPENAEYALGAISETGNLYLNPEAVAAFHVSDAQIERLVKAQREEILRRQRLYRRGRPRQAFKDRLVVVVDDGIATGATFFASVEAIRRERPGLLAAAIPVGPLEVLERVRAVVDELTVISAPAQFWSVGSHYADFRQVTDEEVVSYLHSADVAAVETAARVSGARS